MTNIKYSWKQKTMESFSNYRNECGYGWEDLAEKINNAIIELKSQGHSLNLNIKTKLDRKSCKKIILDGTATRFNEDKYKDLYTVYEYITNSKADVNNKNNQASNRKEIFNEPFTYCTPKFQDTILPHLYKHFYKEFKKIKFEINKDWNEILEAFETKDIQVAVNNFSTALAITRSVKENPAMFFFPLFLFKGYGIIIKKSSVETFCLKHNLKTVPFNKLSQENKKIFLENSTIILEPKTDVEWVYKNYCAKYDVDWNIIKSDKIIPFDVNEGKKKFILKNGSDIYCTNSIHLAHLGKQSDKYEIIKNEEVTKHKNVNGILCTMDFFNKNTEIIKELIFIWYHHIIEFNKEKDEILHDPEVTPFSSDHLKGFNDSLNKYTYSNLSLHELMKSYKSNNEFYTDATKAFNEFYTADFVERHTTDKSFWEIANIQQGRENEDNMREIILELYNNMKSAFAKINND